MTNFKRVKNAKLTLPPPPVGKTKGHGLFTNRQRKMSNFSIDNEV